MKIESNNQKHSVIFPCVAACLLTLALLLLGLAGPAFSAMFKDFGLDPLSCRMIVVSWTHWMWTVPLGVVASIVIINGSRRWSKNVNLIVDICTVVLSVAVLLGFAVLVFTPVFRL